MILSLNTSLRKMVARSVARWNHTPKIMQLVHSPHLQSYRLHLLGSCVNGACARHLHHLQYICLSYFVPIRNTLATILETFALIIGTVMRRPVCFWWRRAVLPRSPVCLTMTSSMQCYLYQVSRLLSR